MAKNSSFSCEDGGKAVYSSGSSHFSLQLPFTDHPLCLFLTPLSRLAHLLSRTCHITLIGSAWIESRRCLQRAARHGPHKHTP